MQSPGECPIKTYKSKKDWQPLAIYKGTPLTIYKGTQLHPLRKQSKARVEKFFVIFEDHTISLHYKISSKPVYIPEDQGKKQP